MATDAAKPPAAEEPWAAVELDREGWARRSSGSGVEPYEKLRDDRAALEGIAAYCRAENKSRAGRGGVNNRSVFYSDAHTGSAMKSTPAKILTGMCRAVTPPSPMEEVMGLDRVEYANQRAGSRIRRGWSMCYPVRRSGATVPVPADRTRGSRRSTSASVLLTDSASVLPRTRRGPPAHSNVGVDCPGREPVARHQSLRMDDRVRSQHARSCGDPAPHRRMGAQFVSRTPGGGWMRDELPCPGAPPP